MGVGLGFVRLACNNNPSSLTIDAFNEIFN